MAEWTNEFSGLAQGAAKLLFKLESDLEKLADTAEISSHKQQSTIKSLKHQHYSWVLLIFWEM